MSTQTPPSLPRARWPAGSLIAATVVLAVLAMVLRALGSEEEA